MNFTKQIAVLGIATLAISACGGSSSSETCVRNGITVDCDTGEPIGQNPNTDPKVDDGSASVSGSTYTITTSDNSNITASPSGSQNGGQPLFLSTVDAKGKPAYFGALIGTNSDFVGAVAASSDGIYLGEDAHAMTNYTLNGDTTFVGISTVVTSGSSVSSNFKIDIAGNGSLDGYTFNSGSGAKTDGLTIEGAVDGNSLVDVTSEYDGEAGIGQLGFYDGGSGNPIELNGVGAGLKAEYGFVISTAEQ